MRIRRISIEKINPAPYNPRIDLRPGDAEYEKIRRSLEEFSCVEPLVWNQRTGNLVGGHQRFKILQAQGAEFVRVSVVDLSLKREKALNVALNKVQGDWDENKLASLLEELVEAADIDVELTGFDLPDIDALLAGVTDDAGENDPDDFDLDAAVDSQQPAITQVGDVIELGAHRLICGDSSDPEIVGCVMDGRSAHLLFTDPPYNVDYYGGSRPTPQKARPKQSRQWQRLYADNQTQEEYESWLESILTHAFEYLNPGSACYLWNGHRQFGPMQLMLTRLGVHVSCVITWAKDNFAIGYGDYNQQTEFCLYGWKQHPQKGKGSKGHRWFGPTNASTLWQVKRDPTKHYSHPTQKPVALAEQAIRNSSQIGDVVLDCFLGSGTTLIACERLRRICCGIEIDPHHCDAIVRRFIGFVGANNVDPELVTRYQVAEGAAS